MALQREGGSGECCEGPGGEGFQEHDRGGVREDEEGADGGTIVDQRYDATMKERRHHNEIEE